jgi:alpha-L-rhamnosidase
MKIKHLIGSMVMGFLITGIAMKACASDTSTSIAIENLRCEYLINPLEIDVLRPRLSWELKSKEKSQNQIAYQVLVASDSMELSRNLPDIWDSGRVKSNKTDQIVFEGKELQSLRYYYWKVRVWDINGDLSDWSPIQHWSFGLLDKADWKAEWISPN